MCCITVPRAGVAGCWEALAGSDAEDVGAPSAALRETGPETLTRRTSRDLVVETTHMNHDPGFRRH
eukprot:1462300-Prymnesium_polylepis.1